MSVKPRTEIHVATVHFHDASWIDPQLRYLERFVDGTYHTWAILVGVENHSKCFDRVVSPAPSGTHWDNLNSLARTVIAFADPADILVFIDGDAFPIAPLRARLEQLLEKAPLAAVRRDENLGDPMPHPIFCATTVGFWSDLGGDWSPDPTLTNELGQSLALDPGGVLLRQLKEAGVGWAPLLRSSGSSPHPLFYGVYGDLIYHHGAGFRTPGSRLDMASAPTRKGLGRFPWELQRFRAVRRNRKLSREVRTVIDRDPDFFTRLRG